MPCIISIHLQVDSLIVLIVFLLLPIPLYSLALGSHFVQKTPSPNPVSSHVNPLLVVGAHVAAPHVVAAHTPAAAVHSRSRGAVAHSPAAADRGHRGPAVDSRSHGAGSRAAAGSRGAADTQNRPAVDSRGADRHLEVDDRMACSGEGLLKKRGM